MRLVPVQLRMDAGTCLLHHVRLMYVLAHKAVDAHVVVVVVSRILRIRVEKEVLMVKLAH